MAALPRDAFSVVAFHIANPTEASSTRVAAAADALVQVDLTINDVRGQIAACAVDVLVFADTQVSGDHSSAVALRCAGQRDRRGRSLRKDIDALLFAMPVRCVCDASVRAAELLRRHGPDGSRTGHCHRLLAWRFLRATGAAAAWLAVVAICWFASLSVSTRSAH